MARFEPAIDSRIAMVLKGLDPPLAPEGLKDANAETVQRVMDALQSRFKDYRAKPPVPFGRVIHAALVRLVSKTETPSSVKEEREEPATIIHTVEASSMNAGLYAPPKLPSVGEKRRRAEPGGGDSEKKKAGQLKKQGADDAGIPGLGVSVDGGFALVPCARPRERYSDVGGLRNLQRELRELFEYPLLHPELYAHLGVDPPTGVLLYGSSGCGKTLLARAIGGELGVYWRQISGPEVVGSVSGESEFRLRLIFDDAIAHAPSIVRPL
jgi:hypothetical protein